MMVPELPLEPLHDAVERVLDVGRLGMRTERLARDDQRCLEPAMAFGPMAFGDDLDLHALHPALDPFESRQLVERELANAIVERNAASLQDEVHDPPLPEPSRARRDRVRVRRWGGRLPSG
jgi:hypothetical protein